jgi:hypothetical protein
MAGNLFSIPAYPNAVSYDVQYCNPLVGNPGRPNKLGPWLGVSGSPFASQSNIYDSSGTQLTMYRVAPTITLPNVGNVALQYYDAFSVYQPAPLYYPTIMYDAQITALLPDFRSYIGDYGQAGSASTNVNIDTGAGIGVLVPDNVTTQYNVADIPDTTPPVILDYSVQIIKNNLDLIFNTDYATYATQGFILFATAPLTTDSVTINYTEVKYSNQQLCSALATAVDMLANFNVNGFGMTNDNNVQIVSGTLSASGLRQLIMAMALKVLDKGLIRVKADQARSYKTQDFSIETAPGRIIDGMASLSAGDYQEIRGMANAYIKTATIPTVRDTYAAFFDSSGTLPVYNLLVGGFYGQGYQAWY